MALQLAWGLPVTSTSNLKLKMKFSKNNVEYGLVEDINRLPTRLFTKVTWVLPFQLVQGGLDPSNFNLD